MSVICLYATRKGQTIIHVSSKGKPKDIDRQSHCHFTMHRARIEMGQFTSITSDTQFGKLWAIQQGLYIHPIHYTHLLPLRYTTPAHKFTHINKVRVPITPSVTLLDSSVLQLQFSAIPHQQWVWFCTYTPKCTGWNIQMGGSQPAIEELLHGTSMAYCTFWLP